MLSTVSFFVIFLIDSSYGKVRSDRVIKSNHLCHCVVDLES